MKTQPTAKDWLLHPFRFVAGWQALAIGLAGMALTAAVGHFSGMHNDGVIDAHLGEGHFGLIFMEGIINWLSMVILLGLGTLLLRGPRPRLIDLAGTQAWARIPMLLVAFTGFFLPTAAIEKWIRSLMETPDAPVPIGGMDIALFVAAGIFTLLCLVWMVSLMWKGFQISANAKGAPAIITFIVAILAAEILSKWAIIQLIHLIQP
jgi:hypothetical protein